MRQQQLSASRERLKESSSTAQRCELSDTVQVVAPQQREAHSRMRSCMRGESEQGGDGCECGRGVECAVAATDRSHLLPLPVHWCLCDLHRCAWWLSGASGGVRAAGARLSACCLACRLSCRLALACSSSSSHTHRHAVDCTARQQVKTELGRGLRCSGRRHTTQDRQLHSHSLPRPPKSHSRSSRWPSIPPSRPAILAAAEEDTC